LTATNLSRSLSVAPMSNHPGGEAGFISNAGEAAQRKRALHQKLIPEAITDGIHDFLTSSKTAAYRK
jgi:hypothetical protein